MASLESLNDLLSKAAKYLDRAASEIRDIPLEPSKEHIHTIGEALANIFEIQHEIYKKRPDLKPEYFEEEPEPDPDRELTGEEIALVKKLSAEQIAKIDTFILYCVRKNWRKVAMIVGTTMLQLENRPKGVPDIFYVQRVKKLVDDGKLEARGNLDYMRFSEVRLPSK